MTSETSEYVHDGPAVALALRRLLNHGDEDIRHAGCVLRAALTRGDDVTAAIRATADVIESTYDHDENGERTDGDCPISGADCVELVANIEGVVFDALTIIETEATS